jgi:hypothetical protein
VWASTIYLEDLFPIHVEEAANNGPSFKAVRLMHVSEYRKQPTMKGVTEKSEKMFKETDCVPTVCRSLWKKVKCTRQFLLRNNV